MPIYSRAMLLLLFVLPLAFGQFPRSTRPKAIQDVKYVYDGQEFTFKTIQGQVFQVYQADKIVLMVSGGNVIPYPGADPHVTAAAEDALKAFQAGKPSGSVNTAAQSANAKPRLTVDGVVMMLDAGVSEDIIVTKIRQSNTSFDLTPEDLVRLKKAKASDALLKAMMQPAGGSPPSQPAPTQTTQPAPEQQTPTTNNSPETKQPEAKKPGFWSQVKQNVRDDLQGNSVIDKLGLRDVLPQWDPNKALSDQWPHIAITVLSAPPGWMEPYMTDPDVHSNSIFVPCFKLEARIWQDAEHSKKVGPFDWCSNKDEKMTQLQPTYLYSLNPRFGDRSYLTGISRTEGPAPPEKLLPNDRATMDMEMKASPQHQSIDLNLDERSRFAIMFANVRADLGQTLTSEGDFRVWIVGIKKAAGISFFR